MNYSARALAALFLIAASAAAQGPSRIYTRPSIPSDEALQKLNLKLGWRTYVPVDGRRDNIFSAQYAPEQKGVTAVLLVQTRSGLICAVDAETGRVRWQARVGRPYHVSVPLGFNSVAVYIVNDQSLFVLDRETGNQLWAFEMPSAATTAPVADDEQVFLSLAGGRVSAYALPEANRGATAKAGSLKAMAKETEKNGGVGVARTSSIGPLASATGGGTRVISSIGALTSARQASQAAKTGFEPHLDWSDGSGLRLDVPPLQTGDSLFLVGSGGRVGALFKGLKQGVRYNQMQADAPIIVPPGQYHEVAYVASQDSNLYAVRIPSGMEEWRFTTGTPITHRPAVTDDDIYLTTDRGGLRRLSRVEGREIWRNRQADRFLAANRKVVYATDPSGRLLLLDRARGTRLATLDARDFVVPITNDLTDRVYLAANDGLFICLHDRDQIKPLRVKKAPPARTAKKNGDKKYDKPEDKPRAKRKADDDEAPPEDKPKAKAKPDDAPPPEDKPKAKPKRDDAPPPKAKDKQPEKNQ